MDKHCIHQEVASDLFHAVSIQMQSRTLDSHLIQYANLAGFTKAEIGVGLERLALIMN